MQKLILFVFLIALPGMLISQNRAPSCWLNYADSFRGDILINTVRVAHPSPLYTYYCTMQWNAGQEAGGYCGIQEHPDGRNFIFSIWDPISTNEPIRPAFVGPGTQTANFGGEGTGLRSLNFERGWETNRWYTFVTRAWDYHSHTHFGFWVYDLQEKKWFHVITMDFPVEGVRFNTATGSFIEDWLGNGQNKRSVHHKNGWKRGSASKRWRAFESARFTRVSPDAGAANYIDRYNGGVAINEYYFMVSGGSSAPVSNESGATLRLSNPESQPVFEPIRISDFFYDQSDNELTVQWQAAESASPQFSWTVEIYQTTPEDSLMDTHSQEVPHQRRAEVDLSGYPEGDYTFHFYLTDVFDQRSDTLTGSFSLGTTGIHPTPAAGKPRVYVSEGGVVILCDQPQCSYRIFALDGRLIASGSCSERPMVSTLPAVFVVQILDENQRVVHVQQVLSPSGLQEM